MELVFTLGKLEIVLNLGILTGAVSGILLKALIVGLLTSVCAAVLGVPLVLKRYSMIGDGLSHMGFCALAIAAALGVPENKETLVTMPLIVAAAVVLLLLSEKGKLKGDAAIAMLSTGAVGLGYIIYRFAGRGTGDVCSSLFGSSITALENSDVWFSCILAVGVIVDVDVRGGSVTVRSEDRMLVYTAEHVRELEPAYAVTIHKSQGSEFPAVIIPVMDVPPKLCYRNLLYTGVTRAKTLCILAGHSAEVAQMVRSVRRNKRFSCLADLIRDETL